MEKSLVKAIQTGEMVNIYIQRKVQDFSDCFENDIDRLHSGFSQTHKIGINANIDVRGITA